MLNLTGNNYFVYIASNQRHTVLYTSVTSNLSKRIWEHKNKINQGFTCRYNVNELVYYEAFDNINQAIFREKQIKNLLRNKKEALINKTNPEWKDLYEDIFVFC